VLGDFATSNLEWWLAICCCWRNLVAIKTDAIMVADG